VPTEGRDSRSSPIKDGAALSSRFRRQRCRDDGQRRDRCHSCATKPAAARAIRDFTHAAIRYRGSSAFRDCARYPELGRCAASFSNGGSTMTVRTEPPARPIRSRARHHDARRSHPTARPHPAVLATQFGSVRTTHDSRAGESTRFFPAPVMALRPGIMVPDSRSVSRTCSALSGMHELSDGTL